ncbi:hypothetical protein [Nocardia salmonicida]|uniref:hypothetical protein n=1 Tax=Nocardia salmonicida TaxID=53431 RepID=UPI003413D296
MEPRRTHADTRPYAIVDALEDLAGPAHGTVELPKQIDWSPQRRYDLDHGTDLQLLYETVLNQALLPSDLTKTLNRSVLVDTWPRLRLPHQVRTLWGNKFPELRTPRGN